MNWFKKIAAPEGWQDDWKDHMQKVFSLSFTDDIKLVKFRSALPNFVAAELQYLHRLYAAHTTLRGGQVIAVVYESPSGRMLLNRGVGDPYGAMAAIRQAILDDDGGGDSDDDPNDNITPDVRTPDLVGVS